MDGKVPKTMRLRNKNAPKVLNSDTPEVSNHLVRMRSPVQIWVAAPEKPVVLQGIAGFSICLEEKLPSRKPIQKPIPIDFKVLIHITPDQLFSEHL